MTIGEVEEAKVPDIVEPDEPSTDLRPYRKGKVRQMVAPQKLRLSDRHPSAPKGH